MGFDEPRGWAQACNILYHLDDLPHSVRVRLQQNPVVNTPSHYSIVTATPSPSNPHNLQENTN